MSLVGLVRASAWWEHKLSPILATVYATAALSQIPLSALWPTVALALFALIVCASYVSVLNDLTDAEDDRVSGKPNRQQEKPRLVPVVMLAACVSAGAGLLFLWRHDPPLFAAYLVCWVAFTLYSTPPFRLKARGIWGVAADACGANLGPTLFAVFLLFHQSRIGANGEWWLVVAVWSCAAGVRGILWHQLEDVHHDQKAGLRTFVCRHGIEAAERLGRLAFLVECIAFATMLWLTGNTLAWLFLLAYALFAWMRRRLLGVGLAALKSRPASRMAMSEYYIVLFPLAYLLTAAFQQPWALALLAFHGIVFSRHGRYMVHEIVTMWRLVNLGISSVGGDSARVPPGKTRS